MPAWNQSLFAWVWSDGPDDDGADEDLADDEDDRPPTLPPLRSRVQARHGPRTALLWGKPVMLAKAPASRTRVRPRYF